MVNLPEPMDAIVFNKKQTRQVFSLGISRITIFKFKEDIMSRIEKSIEKCNDLFGNIQLDIKNTDPDFYEIKKNFIYGDVYAHGNLDDKMREMITIVVAVTNQTFEELTLHIEAALHVGLTPIEVKEAVYHCAPYIGLSKAQAALGRVNDVLKKKEILLPLESQKTVTEDSRFSDGYKAQKEIFGEGIDKMHASAPENQKHIQKFLSAYCFGDFYTRKGLDLKTRELLTFCILCAQGGCENQIRGHISGNVAMGNDKEILLSALTHCIPYIGFPRTLNALNCINEMVSENN